MKIRLVDVPISKKLIIISLFSAGVALFFAGSIIILAQFNAYRHAYIEENMVQARTIGYNCSAALLFYDRKTAENTLESLKNNPKVVCAAIYNSDGALLVEYRKDKKTSLPPPSFPGSEGYSFGIHYFTITQPILFDNDIIGWIVIQSELMSLYKGLLWQTLLFVAAICGAFLLAMFLVSRLHKMVTKPIDALVDLMFEVSRNKDYSLYADIHRKDELGMLAQGFNEMLARIKERDSELEKYSKSLEILVDERTSQLRSSLDEKEVLLKEIHHRVKNNMQIISSLLNLQAGNVREERIHEMFMDTINRIKSMSLIHEQLYQTKDLTRIDFSVYVRSLADNLLSAYRTKSDNVHIKTNVENVHLRIGVAIPCGLIINELVANSLRHAFPEGSAGEIQVNFLREHGESSEEGRSDALYRLIVRDNGVGLLRETDIYTAKSLGLRLVNGLVLQLGGTLELDTGQGTEMRITFSIEE